MNTAMILGLDAAALVLALCCYVLWRLEERGKN